MGVEPFLGEAAGGGVEAFVVEGAVLEEWSLCSLEAGCG